MAWLAEYSEVVDLNSLLSQAPRGNGTPRVALTFDDGYRTLHDVVAPVLAEYGFSATVYLNSGHIGDSAHEPSNASAGHYPDEAFMTWDEVVALCDQNWTIGSHGVEHLDLTLQPLPVIESELATSKQTISERTGLPCEHFSYTWGHHNETVRHAVAATGYRSAVAGTHAPVKPKSDPFALPRVDIRPDYTLEDFAAVVNGCWDYLGLYQRLRGLMR